MQKTRYLRPAWRDYLMSSIWLSGAGFQEFWEGGCPRQQWQGPRRQCHSKTPFWFGPLGFSREASKAQHCRTHAVGDSHFSMVSFKTRKWSGGAKGNIYDVCGIRSWCTAVLVSRIKFHTKNRQFTFTGQNQFKGWSFFSFIRISLLRKKTCELKIQRTVWSWNPFVTWMTQDFLTLLKEGFCPDPLEQAGPDTRDQHPVTEIHWGDAESVMTAYRFQSCSPLAHNYNLLLWTMETAWKEWF